MHSRVLTEWLKEALYKVPTWSASTRAPASMKKSLPDSLASVTVSPDVVVELPVTKTPRGARVAQRVSI